MNSVIPIIAICANKVWSPFSLTLLSMVFIYSAQSQSRTVVMDSDDNSEISGRNWPRPTLIFFGPWFMNLWFKWEPSLGLHTAHAYFVYISIWSLFWYSTTPCIFTFIVHLRTSNKFLPSSTFSIWVAVACITLKICYTNFKLMPINSSPSR